MSGKIVFNECTRIQYFSRIQHINYEDLSTESPHLYKFPTQLSDKHIPLHAQGMSCKQQHAAGKDKKCDCRFKQIIYVNNNTYIHRCILCAYVL